MKVGAQVAIGVAVGYLLGRTRKGRLALTLAAAGVTGKLANNPSQLLKQGATLLGSSPELKSLTGDVRGRLVDAGKAAAVSATSGRINALTNRLEERTEVLRRPRMPGKSGEEEREDPEEPYDEENEELLDEEDVEPDDEEEPPAEEDERRRPAASRGERPRRSTAARGSATRTPVRRTRR